MNDLVPKNSSNTVLQAQEYVFDDASRVTSYVKGAVTTTYGYDDANQLTSESRTGYSASYTYDDNGNRLTRSISGGVSETYSYDSGDKLTGVTWSGGYKDFAYDNAGRMTEYDNNGSVRYFAYDEEGRMTGISGAQTASFTYNGLRTRTAKTENSVTSNYKRDGSGVTSPVLNDGSAAYTPGISERRSSTTTYLHSGLKNAEAQTGTSQTIAAEKTYDAFGNLTASTGTWQGPFGYAGQFGYQEDASGLKLLGHRYYDPTLGRFLTRDPIQDGRNWYVYCENNPVDGQDAAGLVRISVYYREVMAGAYHLYIVVTDNVPGSPTFGQSWTFSAGPERHGLTLNSGLIVNQSGYFGPGNYEHVNTGGHMRPPGGGGVVLVDDQSPYKPWVDEFEQHEDDMMSQGIYYLPIPDGATAGANSNGWVGELLERTGLLDEWEHAIGKKPWTTRPWLPGFNQRPWR